MPPLRQPTLASVASALPLLDLSLPPLLSIPGSGESPTGTITAPLYKKSLQISLATAALLTSEIQSLISHSMCLPNAHQASSYNPFVENQQPILDPNQWFRSFWLDPYLLLEVSPTVRLIPFNYFNFLNLDLGTH